MAHMSAFDASKLAERLHGLGKDQFSLHLEAASMLEKYPAKEHARRVRDKLDVSKGLIYLPGQLAWNNEDSDMPAPFRQRRYFYYMSGCNEADCHLTYDIQHDKLALFIPRIDPERVIWYGRGSTPAEAADKYDVDEVYFKDDLEAWIADWSAHYQGRIFILHDYRTGAVSSFSGEVDSSSLQPAANLARMIKDDHEIKLIRKANDISSEAHKRVLANVLKFKNEAQVEGLFTDVCISHQAKQQAYDIIAASGPNAGTLHYDANNENFDDRQLMCLDAGCEFELYASDITRTFPLSGSWPSAESENIYKLVQRMQETCIKRLAPGVRYLDLHILAHHIAIEGLLRLGILHNGTTEEIYKAGTSKAFFPHGLGHHIGLEVHDVGQRELMSFHERNPKYEQAPSLYPEDYHLPVYNKNLCLAPADPYSPHLEEGMVVTVEPGIYFSAYALSYFYLPSPVHSKYINKEVVYRYFPVGGVRIEDDILITSKSYENLTTAPKGQAMLEIIRSGNAKWPFVSDTECRTSPVERGKVSKEPLVRAPGIPKRMGDLGIKPVVRAATMPVEGTEKRGSADFEPFDGPSLFAGFKRSATVVETSRSAAAHPDRPSPTKTRQGGLPICGNPTLDTTHLYMAWESSGSNPTSPLSSSTAPQTKCTNCTVLMQSMDRLKQIQARVSPSPPKIEPAATRPNPELAQVHERNMSRKPRSSQTFSQPLNPEMFNGSSFNNHGAVEKKVRDPENANSAKPSAYETHRMRENYPFTSTAIAHAKREAERVVTAQRDVFPTQPSKHTMPQQPRAEAPAADTHSTQPTSIATAIQSSLPSHNTNFPTTTQVLRHRAAALEPIDPSPHYHLSNRHPSFNIYRQSATAHPTLASLTSSTSRPLQRSAPNATLSGAQRPGIRPDDAALWEQLEELRGAMEGLLREREEWKRV